MFNRNILLFLKFINLEDNNYNHTIFYPLSKKMTFSYFYFSFFSLWKCLFQTWISQATAGRNIKFKLQKISNQILCILLYKDQSQNGIKMKSHFATHIYKGLMQMDSLHLPQLKQKQLEIKIVILSSNPHIFQIWNKAKVKFHLQNFWKNMARTSKGPEI